MIHTTFGGQLGNQLFQYVLGKIVAARSGQAYHPGSHWLDKAARPLSWSQAAYLVPQASQGRVLAGPPQNIQVMHWIDLNAVDPNRPVRLCGYFQRYELLKPWKDRIRQDWLAVSVALPKVDAEAVYIHVRRKDYVCNDPGCPTLNPRLQCVAHPLAEYAACILRFGAGRRLVLVSDDPTDPFLQEFRRFGQVEVRIAAWDQDFLMLLGAQLNYQSVDVFLVGRFSWSRGARRMSSLCAVSLAFRQGFAWPGEGGEIRLSEFGRR